MTATTGQHARTSPVTYRPMNLPLCLTSRLYFGDLREDSTVGGRESHEGRSLNRSRSCFTAGQNSATVTVETANTKAILRFRQARV